MLDPMMAKDIDETMKAYEMKKKPILEVSKKKKLINIASMLNSYSHNINQ